MEIMGILEIPWMPNLQVYVCGGAWFRAAGCAGRGLFLLWTVAWAPLGGRWGDCVSSGRCSEVLLSTRRTPGRLRRPGVRRGGQIGPKWKTVARSFGSCFSYGAVKLKVSCIGGVQ